MKKTPEKPLRGFLLRFFSAHALQKGGSMKKSR